MSTYSNNDWRYYEGGELYHYGILGQKWGIRRYQNADGSLTEAGRKRYQKGVYSGESLYKRNKPTTYGKLVRGQVAKDTKALYDKYKYSDAYHDWKEAVSIRSLVPEGLSKDQKDLVDDYAKYCEDKEKYIRYEVDREFHDMYKNEYDYLPRSSEKFDTLADGRRDAEKSVQYPPGPTPRTIMFERLSFESDTKATSDSYVSPDLQEAYSTYCRKIEPTVNQYRKLTSKLEKALDYLAWDSYWEGDKYLAKSDIEDRDNHVKAANHFNDQLHAMYLGTTIKDLPVRSDFYGEEYSRIGEELERKHVN